MKNLILLFLLPLLSFAVIEDAKTVALDEQAVIDFPVEPRYDEHSGNKVWMGDIDSTSKCTAMVLNFEEKGWDSVQIEAELGNPEAFEIFKQGLLDRMEGATIIEENEIKEGEVAHFDFVLEITEAGGTEYYLYNKNYFVGNKMYTLNFYQAERKEDEVAKRFFESFKVKEL